MDRGQLTQWLEGYEKAWRMPGTEVLAKLFTDDATYSTARYEMSSEIVAVEGDAGVIRVEVQYHEPKNKEYRDLWIVGLNDAGLCFRFEEWPFWPPDQQGAAATGAV